MKIAIDVNGVLRDTIGKFKQLYEKHLVDSEVVDLTLKTYSLDMSGNTELQSFSEPFTYKILSSPTSLELDKHFSFQSNEEYYSFMYEEYCMEIFGHAPSSEMNTFNTLNELYKDMRNNHDFLIISDEIGKSKPATLFFLSKFVCEIEKIIFFSNYTINQIWDNFDILLTANPNLLLNHPDDKLIIKFETEYNKHLDKDHSITNIKDFEPLLKTLII